MTEDEMRVAIIEAVASLGGYENPNTTKGDWWDRRCKPVYEAFARARRALEDRAYTAGRRDAMAELLDDVRDRLDQENGTASYHGDAAEVRS